MNVKTHPNFLDDSLTSGSQSQSTRLIFHKYAQSAILPKVDF